MIYPPVCAFCGKIDENFLCEECNKKFERLTNVHIQKYKNKTYAEHIYMFKYTDIRREILEYKFDDQPIVTVYAAVLCRQVHFSILGR